MRLKQNPKREGSGDDAMAERDRLLRRVERFRRCRD